MIEYQGATYFDDRLYVFCLCQGKWEIEGEHVVTTIYHDPSDEIQKGGLIWCLATYRNCPGYKATNIDHFTTRESAANYLNKVEPETPLISLGGRSPNPPLSSEAFSLWKSEMGLTDYDYRNVFPGIGTNPQESIVQTIDSFTERLHRQDSNGAKSILASAASGSSDSSELWNNLGLALRKLGRNEEALVAYDKAMRVELTAAFKGAKDKGLWFVEQKNGEALVFKDGLMDLVHSHLSGRGFICTLLRNVAVILLEQGERERGVLCIVRALILSPDDRQRKTAENWLASLDVEPTKQLIEKAVKKNVEVFTQFLNGAVAEQLVWTR